MKLQYTSKKGKPVEVEVLPHAMRRFKERYYRVSDCDAPPEEQFRRMFREASVLNSNKLTKTYKKRNKRHGNNSLYLRNSEVTFVVEDGKIMTVEISAGGLRHLN